MNSKKLKLFLIDNMIWVIVIGVFLFFWNNKTAYIPHISEHSFYSLRLINDGFFSFR